MKLTIMCQSLLLEKALELFLKPYVVPYKQSDFIVCDYKVETNKPQFRLKSSDSKIPFPFSKSTLLLSLEKFSQAIELASVSNVQKKPSELVSDFATLEEKLNKICNQFNKEIIQAVKEHYGK